MGIIKADKLVFEYIRRDEEGNVEGITRAVDEVDLDGTFVFLLLFVLLCAFFAQYLTGAETLQDYADNNPELAYGRSETEEPPDTELVK